MQQWARFAILGAMFVTAYLLILAWQKDYGHAGTAVQSTPAAVVAHDVSADLPNSQAPAVSSDLPQANIAAAQQTTAASTAAVNQQLISVQTDLYHLWISPKGGDIVRIELLNHDKSKNSDESFVMLENDAKRTYVAQSGLIGLNGPDSNRAGRPTFEFEKASYTLADAKAATVDGVKDAKVKVVLPEEGIFVNDVTQESSAMIMLTTAPGQKFTDDQIKTLFNIAAKSVPNLY